MPRTIDSIVACHQIARERMAQGKPAWDRTIKIKQHLSVDVDPILAGKAIARALRNSSWCAKDMDVEELAEFFDEIDEDWKGYYDTPTDRLNGLLDDLYDLADAARVWVA